MVKTDDKAFVNASLREQGIKFGVKQVSRTHFLDEDGEFHEDEMQFAEDRNHFKSPCANAFAKCLVWLHCIPPDPEDMFGLKNWLLWAQWMALICDVGAAVVALVTFSDVTYCCGDPILDIAGGHIPWKHAIRALTYAYLALVFLEIYPVVRQGFPFNVVNPLIGFLITFAMFFDDSKTEALIMWGVESAAILCEYVLFRLKVLQIANQEIEIHEVGQKTKMLRAPRDGEDPDEPARERKKLRQRYYQLKQEQATDNTLLWYLGAGCYVNIVLALIVLVLVIVIAQGGGLCINDFEIPNPFDLNQIGRCPLCADDSELCEICTEETTQCYYPYA